MLPAPRRLVALTLSNTVGDYTKRRSVSAITDAGLVSIRQLTDLEALEISGDAVR